jgi:hypothetical protein
MPWFLAMQETFYLVSMASLDASTGSEHLDTEDMHYLREKVRPRSTAQDNPSEKRPAASDLRGLT